MGMNGSDYGGGTPVSVVWRRDAGLAVGHLETVPRPVSFPVGAQPGGTRIGISGDEPVLLRPGATLTLPTAFVMSHHGDHFALSWSGSVLTRVDPVRHRFVELLQVETFHFVAPRHDPAYGAALYARRLWNAADRHGGDVR